MHLPIAVGEGEVVGGREGVREGSEESSGSEGGEEEIVDVCDSVREWGEEGRFEQGQLEGGRLEEKIGGDIGGKGNEEGGSEGDEVGGREREHGEEGHFEATVAGKGAMIRRLILGSEDEMLTWHAQWQLLQSSFRLASHNFDAAFSPSLLIVSAIASTLLAVAFAVAPLFEFTDFSTPVVLGVVTAIHLDFALLLLTIVRADPIAPPRLSLFFFPLTSHSFFSSHSPTFPLPTCRVLLLVSVQKPISLLASLSVSRTFSSSSLPTPFCLLPSLLLLACRVLLSVSVQSPSPLLPSLSMNLRLLRRYSHAYLALNFGLLGVLSSLAAPCLLTPLLTHLPLSPVPSLPRTYPPSPPGSPSLPRLQSAPIGVSADSIAPPRLSLHDAPTPTSLLPRLSRPQLRPPGGALLPRCSMLPAYRNHPKCYAS
ncbi:unnamed protein product [Closterium sp. Naga37s-1]|nr:unnamed protein product [Closterium sp. Naga37s-1]